MTRDQELEPEVALSPAQCWFFEQAPAEPNQYNLVIAVRFRVPLSPNLAQRVLDEIARRHDAFSLRFSQSDDGSWHQVVSAEAATIPVEHLTGNTQDTLRAQLEHATTRLQLGIDIHTGPVARAALLDHAGRDDVLVIVAHHLVIDAISWRILLEDMEHIATALFRNNVPAFSAPSMRFAEWSNLIASHVPDWSEEIDYWRQRIPVGDRRRRSAPPQLHACRLLLPMEITQSLLATAVQTGRGVDHLILAAVASVLRDCLGLSELLVDVELHGRDEVVDGIDLSHSIGWFTAIAPIYLSSLSAAPASLAGEIARLTASVSRGGLSYGALRYIARTPELVALRDADILFTYLGRAMTDRRDDRLFDVIQGSDGGGVTALNASAYRVTANSWIEDDRLVVDLIWDMSFAAADVADAAGTAVANALTDLAKVSIVRAEQANRIVTPPTSATETIVLAAWEEVLRDSSQRVGSEWEPIIGVEDDFALLGGDSIHMIQVVSRLRRSLNIRVPLRILNEYGTIRALASKIDAVIAGTETF